MAITRRTFSALFLESAIVGRGLPMQGSSVMQTQKNTYNVIIGVGGRIIKALSIQGKNGQGRYIMGYGVRLVGGIGEQTRGKNQHNIK
jgi:hypothetical protein